VSQSDSLSDTRLNKKFLKFHSNLMQRFRVDLKIFLGLAMPNQCHCAVKKLIFGGFLGGIFWKETPNLNDPYRLCIQYYCTILPIKEI